MGVIVAADYAARASADVEYLPGIADTVFRNDQLIGGIIPRRGYQAGDGVKVTAVTAANSSVENFVEGQSAPSRGKQTVIASEVVFKHTRAMVGETGHAMRLRGPRDQGMREADPDFEIRMAMIDIIDLQTTTFLTAATYGVEGIISDSTYNWGDKSRATYTTLVSYLLNASGAALSTSLVNKARFRSREAPYGARVQVWLSAPLQTGVLAEVASGKVAFPNLDGAPSVVPAGVASAEPWVDMPDLSANVALGLSDVDGSWGYTSNQEGEWHLRPYGAQDDSDTLQIATAGCVWCKSPNKQVKIHTITDA